MNRISATALFLASSFALAGPLHAQRSTTDGLNLEFHLTGGSLEVEGSDEDYKAGGAGILLAYGFGSKLAAFLQIDGAVYDVENATVSGEWTIGHVDLGARFHFASPERRWVPFAQAALTGRGVEVDDAQVDGAGGVDARLTGGGLSLGGGLLFFMKETLALDLQLMFSGGEFSEIEIEDITISGLGIDADSSRLSLGLSWWP